jgi:hypothetical protein
MEKIKIKGNDYIPVNQKVLHFRQNFTEANIETELLEFNFKEGYCVVKAIIKQGETILASGLAHEFRDDSASFVNATSFLENAETSAIGRALACLGVGIDDSYASADEVQRAQAMQKPKATPASNTSISSGDWQSAIVPIGKNKGKTLGELELRSLSWYQENFEANEAYQDSVAFREALDESMGKPEAAESEQSDSDLDEEVPF